MCKVWTRYISFSLREERISLFTSMARGILSEDLSRYSSPLKLIGISGALGCSGGYGARPRAMVVSGWVAGVRWRRGCPGRCRGRCAAVDALLLPVTRWSWGWLYWWWPHNSPRALLPARGGPVAAPPWTLRRGCDWGHLGKYWLPCGLSQQLIFAGSSVSGSLWPPSPGSWKVLRSRTCICFTIFPLGCFRFQFPSRKNSLSGDNFVRLHAAYPCASPLLCPFKIRMSRGMSCWPLLRRNIVW